MRIRCSFWGFWGLWLGLEWEASTSASPSPGYAGEEVNNDPLKDPHSRSTKRPTELTQNGTTVEPNPESRHEHGTSDKGALTSRWNTPESSSIPAVKYKREWCPWLPLSIEESLSIQIPQPDSTSTYDGLPAVLQTKPRQQPEPQGSSSFRESRGSENEAAKSSAAASTSTEGGEGHGTLRQQSNEVLNSYITRLTNAKNAEQSVSLGAGSESPRAGIPATTSSDAYAESNTRALNPTVGANSTTRSPDPKPHVATNVAAIHTPSTLEGNTSPTSPAIGSASAPKLSASGSSPPVIAPKVLSEMSKAEASKEETSSVQPDESQTLEESGEAPSERREWSMIHDSMPRPRYNAEPTASPEGEEGSVSNTAELTDYVVENADDSLGPKLVHRYNFANFDSGARIVSYAPHLKNVYAVQKGSAETYMIGACNEPTWIVMAFPEQINLEYLGLHFLELYTSTYTEIAVMGAQSFPTADWKLLAIVRVGAGGKRNYFDLKPSCSRLREGACWISHIKFQVLKYRESNRQKSCTLSHAQVFGSTVLQNLETKLSSSKDLKPTAPTKEWNGWTEGRQQLLPGSESGEGGAVAGARWRSPEARGGRGGRGRLPTRPRPGDEKWTLLPTQRRHRRPGLGGLGDDAGNDDARSDLGGGNFDLEGLDLYAEANLDTFDSEMVHESSSRPGCSSKGWPGDVDQLDAMGRYRKSRSTIMMPASIHYGKDLQDSDDHNADYPPKNDDSHLQMRTSPGRAELSPAAFFGSRSLGRWEAGGFTLTRAVQSDSELFSQKTKSSQSASERLRPEEPRSERVESAGSSGGSGAEVRRRELLKATPSEVFSSLAYVLEEDVRRTEGQRLKRESLKDADEKNAAPPLIALVDKVKKLELELSVQANITQDRLELFHESVLGTKALSDQVRNQSRIIAALRSKSEAYEELLHISLLKSAFAKSLATKACSEALRSIAAHKRVTCTIATLLVDIHSREYDDLGRAVPPAKILHEFQHRLSHALAGISSFTFENMIKLKRRSLQARTSEKSVLEARDRSEERIATLYTKDRAYRAGKGYLDFLRRRKLVVRLLPEAHGPVSLYVAVRLAEFLCLCFNSRVLLLSFVCAAFTYLFFRVTQIASGQMAATSRLILHSGAFEGTLRRSSEGIMASTAYAGRRATLPSPSHIAPESRLRTRMSAPVNCWSDSRHWSNPRRQSFDSLCGSALGSGVGSRCDDGGEGDSESRCDSHLDVSQESFSSSMASAVLPNFYSSIVASTHRRPCLPLPSRASGPDRYYWSRSATVSGCMTLRASPCAAGGERPSRSSTDFNTSDETLPFLDQPRAITASEVATTSRTTNDCSSTGGSKAPQSLVGSRKTDGQDLNLEDGIAEPDEAFAAESLTEEEERMHTSATDQALEPKKSVSHTRGMGAPRKSSITEEGAPKALPFSKNIALIKAEDLSSDLNAITGIPAEHSPKTDVSV